MVTLLTGDRVEVASDGTPLGVEPGAGRAGIEFVAYALDGHQYAVPQDAQPLISSGRLDPHLFDLTELVQLGYL